MRGEDGTAGLDGGGLLQGELKLKDIALRPTRPGAPPVRAGDLDLSVDLSSSEKGRRLDIRKLQVGSGATRLAADGTLVLGGQSSRIDVKVRPSQVMASDLATVAALLGASFPPGLSSSAPISFQGDASGPLDQPERLRFHGRISMSGVRYADPSLGKPIEDVSGTLTFENDALEVKDLAARVGGTLLQGSVSVRDFGSPQVALTLRSPKANLDELIALMTPSSGAPGQSSASSGDALDRTRGSGTIRIEEGTFGTFRFTRFDGSLRLAEKVVTFDPVRFELYGGTYQGALTADLSAAEPRYAYRSSLSGVDAQPFLAENLGIEDLLAGRVSADLEMEGTGAAIQAVLSSMKGRGTIAVSDGWVGKLDVMGGLAKASDLFGEKTLARLSSDMAGKRTDFSSLTGDVTLSGGRAVSNNLKLVSKVLDLEGKGGFTLAGVLDLDLKVLLSKEVTASMLAEGSRARYLGREGDRIVLPVTIKGPIASPSYGVDLEAIARSAATNEALERLSGSRSTLGKLAGSLLGGSSRSAPQAPAAPGASDPRGDSAPAVAPSSDGAIRIDASKYEGSFLLPDLIVRGEFSGVSLSGADIRVDGKGGRAVWEKADAFPEIAAYYADHDPKAKATIPFRIKIDGKKLLGAGDLKITLTLRRSDGTSAVHTFTEKKRGL